MTPQHIAKKIKERLIRYGKNTVQALRPKKLVRTALYRAGLYKLLKKEFAGLHLGSGNTRIKDFINLDSSYVVDADIVAKVVKIKVADNSLGAVYASHVFEHTDRTKAVKILREWHRVLRPGGILYIAVPDLEKLFGVYLENIKTYENDNSRAVADKACRIIYGGQTNKYDYHFYGYSFVTLKYVLEQAGFKKIERFDAMKTALVAPGADASFASISLNVKATK